MRSGASSRRALIGGLARIVRRHRLGRGPRAGRAGGRARAVAAVGHPGQPGGLADGHGQAPRDRSAAPAPDGRANATRSWGAGRSARTSTSQPDLAAAADDDIGDDLLSLLFATCHPMLSTQARAALTLRLFGGLTTPRSPGRSWSRRRRSPSASCGPSARWPRRACRSRCRRGAELGPRLASVLEVIYLIFNEGYAATAGEDWMRPALCEDALRVGRILAELAARASPRSTGWWRSWRSRRRGRGARVGPDGRAGAAARSGPLALGPRADPPRPARRWRAPRRSAARSAPTRCRRRSRPATRGRARRTQTDWGRIVAALRRAGAAHPLTGGGAQPRGRGFDGVRARRRRSNSSTHSSTSTRSATTTCCPACAPTCWRAWAASTEARAELERAAASHPERVRAAA